MAYPDLSDLRDRVRALTNETSTRFYSDAQLNRWINDGERDVAAKTLCMESIVAKSCVNGTRTIDTSAYLKVLAAEYVPASGTRVGLTKITPLYLGHLSLNGTEPQFWFEWSGVIGIEPKPNSTYSLKLYVASMPSAEMSADANEPEISAAYQPYIVTYAYYKALMRDDMFAKAGSIYLEYMNDLNVVRYQILLRYTNTRYDIILPDRIKET